MAKDPAFLFYSKDFYEGTRLMLPEERACLIDLMIYQHQNGGIVNNTKRLSMYCSGVSEEIIKSTLEQKFTLIDNMWYNDKMLEVTKEREEKGRKNKLIGTFAYVLKKLNLNKIQEKELRAKFNVDELLKYDTDWNTERLTEWCKKGIALIEDANANEDINKSIEEREREFKDAISEHKETYNDILTLEFFDYWSERGEKDKKMRFEKESSFDISKRLARWKRNQEKFNKNTETITSVKGGKKLDL